MASKGCSDDAVACAASMPVAVVRKIIPTMIDRCLHVSALLTAETNRPPTGTLYTGIWLTSDWQRRMLLLRDYLIRT